MKWLLQEVNQTFFSEKAHICILKISRRSLWSDSSQHLVTPLFVDWFPIGQWLAVSSAVLKRRSMHSRIANRKVPQIS